MQFCLYLRFVFHDRLKVLPSAPLTIGAEYVGSSCDDPVEYKWILFEQSKQSTNWTSILNNSETASVLAIEPNTLEEKTVYRLELNLLLGNGTPSKSAQVFRTAELPKDGVCDISPDTGEAVFTSFQLLCSGWFAAVNETLTYEVQIEGSGGITFILSRSSNERQTFVLPQGNVNHNYSYNIKVYILRSNGASSEKDIAVTVRKLKSLILTYRKLLRRTHINCSFSICVRQVLPPTKTKQQDIFASLEKNATSFEKSLDNMVLQSAWQLMSAMLLTIESQEMINSSSLNLTQLAKHKSIVSILAVFFPAKLRCF